MYTHIMYMSLVFSTISLAISCVFSIVAVADEFKNTKTEDNILLPLEVEYEDEDRFLYETVVVAHRPPLSAGDITVSGEEIDRIHPSSADEVLRLVPGVKIVQHGSEGKGHQLLLRGFDAAHGSDVEAPRSALS